MGRRTWVGLDVCGWRNALAQAIGVSALVVGCTDRTIAGQTGEAQSTGGSGEPATSTGEPVSEPTTEVVTSGVPGVTTTGEPPGTATGEVTTGQVSGDGTTGATTSGITTEAGSSSTSGDTSTGVAFETGEECGGFDIGEPIMEVDAEMLPGCLVPENPCGSFGRKCVPLPPGAASCEECEPNCLDFSAVCEWWLPQYEVSCGPYAEDGQCCYIVTSLGICGDGRPCLVEGVARQAELESRGDWCAELSSGTGDSEALEVRAALARRWAAAGLAEHASVAAFARFMLQLMAHGAPPGLLAETRSALADEVEHARLCFALASRHASAPVGPGAFGEAASGLETGLREVVLALVHEGCVGETIAAAIAEHAARVAEDSDAREVLARIAADERRHSLLSWRSLRWLLARGDAALREEVARALAFATTPPAPADELPAALLRRHGLVPAHEADALARECLSRLIRPAAQALFDAQASELRIAA
jgi:hypothetical protein